jgi:hypothetical protein
MRWRAESMADSHSSNDTIIVTVRAVRRVDAVGRVVLIRRVQVSQGREAFAAGMPLQQ